MRAFVIAGLVVAGLLVVAGAVYFGVLDSRVGRSRQHGMAYPLSSAVSVHKVTASAEEPSSVVLGPEYDPYIVPQYSLTPQRTELLQLKPVEDRLLDTVKPQKLQWLLVCLAVPGLAQCGEYSVEP